MENNSLLREFEDIIEYYYKDIKLLKQALTHSSYSNEHNLPKNTNNERLEFLGDAILELMSSEYLYDNYPDKLEGELTKLRASIVCEQTLSACAKLINLGKYLFLGKGETRTGGRTRDSILSDTLEAVIGSIYLDGGFANAKEFIDRFILKDIEKKNLFFDSKTILQEIIQSENKDVLKYILVREEGPDHDKQFMVNAKIGDKILGTGIGRTKKAAEQEAAYNSILKLRNKKN